MEKHVILQRLLDIIKNDDEDIDVVCAIVEDVFNSQESDINKLFEDNETLKTEYESLLMDYERLEDNPSVVVCGLPYNAPAIEILLRQIAAGNRQVESLVDEIHAKDDMIDAMIEGFNLRNRIHYDRYDVGDYDWQLVLNRIKMSVPDERLVRIEQMEEELKELKNEILVEK